jgi:hypothetical protein
MEAIHQFKIYYDKVLVWAVVSHTKWEAIDRAYYRYITQCPTIDRAKFKAKKVF